MELFEWQGKRTEILDKLKPKHVTITPDEYLEAVEITCKRQATYAVARVRDKRLTAFAAHLYGTLGEYAAAQTREGAVVSTVVCHGHGDTEVADVTLPDGRGVEVKSTRFGGSGVNMIIEPGKFLLERLHCLVIVNTSLIDQCLVYPMIEGESFREHHEMRDFGYGLKMALRAEQIVLIAANERMEARYGPCPAFSSLWA